MQIFRLTLTHVVVYHWFQLFKKSLSYLHIFIRKEQEEVILDSDDTLVFSKISFKLFLHLLLL